MRRVVLHIGMPKTGTTAVQALLPEPLERAGWDVCVEREVGHDAALLGVFPRLLERSSSQGLWEEMLAGSDKPLFVSHEGLSMTSAARAAELIAATDGQAEVIITVRDIAETIHAWWYNLTATGEPRSFEEWAETLNWRSFDPEPDGAAMRGDVAFVRWRTAASRQVYYVTEGTDTVRLFAHLLGVEASDRERSFNKKPSGLRLTEPSRRALQEANIKILTAINAGQVADLDGCASGLRIVGSVPSAR